MPHTWGLGAGLNRKEKLISWWTREQWPKVLHLLCDSYLEAPSLASQDNFNDPITTFLIFFPCSFNLLAKTAEKGFWKFRLIQVTCQCIKAKGLLVYIFRCVWPRLKPWFSKQDEMKTSRIDIAKELRDVSGAQILIPTQTYRSSNYEDAAQWAVVRRTLWVTLRKHETRWPTSDSQLVWPSLSWGLVFK